MIIINDQYILNNFLDKNGNANRRKLQKSYLNNEEYNYLINRFNSYTTLSEIIYRIKFKIEKLPICPVCGKEMHFIKPSRPFNKYCSHICKNKSEIHNNLIKQTCLKRYGKSNPLSIKQFREKAKLTKLKRYGDKNYNNRKKYKETCIEKYNVESPLCHGKLRELGKQTLIKKYGVDNFGKTKEQILRTHSEEVNTKRELTKKRNNTFNTSKPELESYDLLKQKYPDVIHHYKDNDRYPFNCDFYIPSLDLFIECQYGQFHHGRPYLGTEEDLKDIELLKEKANRICKEKNVPLSRYNIEIETWTIRDVNKRNTAKQNNLNWIEFWNINELKKWLDK